MIIKNKILVVVVLVAWSLAAQAQQFPLLNHYAYNPYLYNPARTGQNEFGTASFHFKKQWTDLPSSPFSGIVSLETPILIEKLGNMGLGGMFYVDQAHLTTNIGGLGSYAYHIPFQKSAAFKHGLSAGLSLGFIHQRFNYPDAVVDDPNDQQLIPSEGAGTTFDFSLGLDYQWRDLHVGISMLQGLNIGINPIVGSTGNITFVNTRQFIGLASYKYTFNKGEKPHPFYVKPIVLARIIQDIPVQLEGNVIVGMEGLGWIGVGYRSSNNAISTSNLDLTIGVEVKRKIIFAYTFSPNVGAAIQNSMGIQHEFMLAYRFGENPKIKILENNVSELQKQNEELELTIQNNQKRTDSIANVLEQTIIGTEKNAEKLQEQQAKLQQQEEILEQQQTTLQQQEKTLEQQQTTLQQQGSDININKAAIEELRKAIKKQPLQYKKVGQVFFGLGATQLSETSKANLDAVLQTLQDSKNKGNEIQVFIQGNASTDGDPQKNMELSMRRAAQVRQYLVNKGLDASLVKVVPLGEEDPNKGSTGSSKGEAGDRRVDIIFTEKPRKGRL